MDLQVVVHLVVEKRILLENRYLEKWRIEYNQVRPHGGLGYKPPAP
jgi:transposase InsO family protein